MFTLNMKQIKKTYFVQDKEEKTNKMLKYESNRMSECVFFIPFFNELFFPLSLLLAKFSFTEEEVLCLIVKKKKERRNKMKTKLLYSKRLFTRFSFFLHQKLEKKK